MWLRGRHVNDDDPVDNPCRHCGVETGSDAMAFCSFKCQQSRLWLDAAKLWNNANPEAA